MKIIKLEKTGKDTGLIATFDVEIDTMGLILRKLKYVSSDKGTFINYPAKVTKDANDKWVEEFKWYEFSPERSKDFFSAVKELVKQELDTPQVEEEEKFW